MSAITDRVAAGAAFLDEHDPEWWRADVERAIDLDELNLDHGAACVLGQRCPLDRFAESRFAVNRYEAQAQALSGYDIVDASADLTEWAIDGGFYARETGEYEDLTAEWKRVITERRSTP